MKAGDAAKGSNEICTIEVAGVFEICWAKGPDNGAKEDADGLAIGNAIGRKEDGVNEQDTFGLDIEEICTREAAEDGLVAICGWS